MMGWLGKLFSQTSLIDKAVSAVDNLHLSAEEKNKHKLDLQKIIQSGQLEIEQSLRKELEARERVLVAELNQGDSYTKRARPTVVYFGLVMIGLNYLVIPLIAMLAGSEDIINFPLPAEFWAAWGGIVATWSIGRSFEKNGISNKLSNLVTGSNKNISILSD